MIDGIKIKDYFVELENECLIRGFSKRTIKTYSYFVQEYFLQLKDESSFLVNKEDIKRYVLWQIKSRRRTEETIRLSLAAISFFAKSVLKINIAKLDELLVRPKRKKKLPKVLSKNQIEKMIEVTTNIKHRLIIKILYSSGLRLNEFRNLK